MNSRPEVAPESAEHAEFTREAQARSPEPKRRSLLAAVAPRPLDKGEAELEAAIARLTRALTAADDSTIAEIVAERKALREELRRLREREAGNVIPLQKRVRS